MQSTEVPGIVELKDARSMHMREWGIDKRADCGLRKRQGCARCSLQVCSRLYNDELVESCRVAGCLVNCSHLPAVAKVCLRENILYWRLLMGILIGISSRHEKRVLYVVGARSLHHMHVSGLLVIVS